MDLDHVGNDLTAGQAVVDAVGALALTVADIGTVIAGTVAARLRNALAHFFHQGLQVAAAGVAVTGCTFNENLRLGQVFRFPAGADPQGIQFRGQGAHLLTDQTFHGKILAFIQLQWRRYDAGLCGGCLAQYLRFQTAQQAKHHIFFGYNLADIGGKCNIHQTYFCQRIAKRKKKEGVKPPSSKQKMYFFRHGVPDAAGVVSQGDIRCAFRRSISACRL